MLKIAVCDDNLSELTEIEKLIDKFFKLQKNTDVSVTLYQSPQILLDDVEEIGIYAIYFLDIIFPQFNGIQLEEALRKLDSNGIIIYMTISEEYALDAFRVFAFQYLLKPIREQKLFQTLERVLEHTKDTYSFRYPLKTKDGTIWIPFPSIVYVELKERSVYVHLYNQEILKSIYIRGTFESVIQSLLEDERFIRTHKSYVANLYQIYRVETNCLLMENNEKVPISRAYSTEVKKQYVKILMKRKHIQES